MRCVVSTYADRSLEGGWQPYILPPSWRSTTGGTQPWRAVPPWRAQQLLGRTLDLFVLDDASWDETAEAIAERHHLRRLHGQSYWSCGMGRAFVAAMTRNYDYYFASTTTLRSTMACMTSCYGRRASVGSADLSSWRG